MAEIENFGSISKDQPPRLHVCKVIWVIKNFKNYCCSVGDFFESPHFFIDCDKTSEWSLDIFFKGFDNNSKEYVSIRAYDFGGSYGKYAALFALLDKGGNNSYDDIAHVADGEGLVKEFIGMADLLSLSDQLLTNNELRISCVIVDLSVNKISDGGVNEKLQPQKFQLEGFDKLLNSEKFSDFKLIVQEQEFSAHRAILAARSPIFEAMFDSNMRESKEGKVHIDDIEPKVMEKLLLFMYTGEVHLEDLVEEVLAASDKYQLNSLKIVCEDELANKLSVDNVYDVILLSDRNNAASLKAKAMEFFAQNLKKLAAEPIFTASVESLPGSVKTEIIRVIALSKFIK